MNKLVRGWNFIRRHKDLITTFGVVVVLGFIDENNLPLTRSRLLICQRVAERIKKGLEFLGVSAPEKM